MNITIDIIYMYENNCRLSEGRSFPVNIKNYQNNPDQEAARVAFDWWKLLRRERSNRVSIEKIIYNGEIDITELVKELENSPLPDLDLSF